MPAKKTSDNQKNNIEPKAAKGESTAGAAEKSAAPKRGSRAQTAGDAVQSAAKVARKAVKKVASAIGDVVSELSEKKAKRDAAAAGGKEAVGKAGALKKTAVKAKAMVDEAVGATPKGSRSRKKAPEAMSEGTTSADVQALIDSSVTSGALGGSSDIDASNPTEVRLHFIEEQAHNVAPPPAEHRELPDDYGDTKLVVLVRDPEWVYAYWEINADRKRELGLQDNDHGRRMVLRFYKVSGRNWPSDAAEYFFDVDVSPYAVNWYIKLPEVNEQWVSELGFFDDESAFVAVCQSNAIETPRNTISDVVDSEWMTVEESFRKITMIAGGDLQSRLNGTNGTLPGSESILRQLNRHIAGVMLGERAALSSGIFSSGELAGRGPGAGKGFWLQAHTELILYGATEPDARVTVQGQPVQLAADGTFSMRFALPEGEQVLTVKGVSVDGEFEETITPVVNRTTR